LIPISDLKNPREKIAYLVFEDGDVFKGVGFGAVGKVSGEIVFNTGMVGYTESITDPSYKGQILIQTYPLVGNYGVCSDFFESDGPKIEGYVVHELCKEPNHWSSTRRLGDWLEDCGIPGIESIDTRKLTKKIRSHGTMLGILYTFYKEEPPNLDDIILEASKVVDPNSKDLIAEISTKKRIKFTSKGKHNVVVIDCGTKKSIINNLTLRGFNVTLVPPNEGVDEILGLHPQGVIISNGPGDPKIRKDIATLIFEISEKVPVLGICMGLQLIAIAFGANTFKLKFGHRGQNHPVIDTTTNRCFITSQNHGFAVDKDSLYGTGLQLTMINANDKTVEGVKHKTLPVFGVQFHPEASPGPNDSNYIFDQFLKQIKKS
jgi:carbamoyl-phosphate synthase small subunit